MTLLETINSIGLETPIIKLDDRGVSLHYADKSMYDRVMLVLSGVRSLSDFVQIMPDSNTLLIQHFQLSAFLLQLSAIEMGLNDAIESFYLDNQVDRAAFLAQESISASARAQAMPDDMLSIESVALSPMPKQLLAKIKIKMPDISAGTSTQPSRVVFLLDRSESMNDDGRMEMLKPAVLHSIDQLSPDTLVSVYFYNDTVETLFESKRVCDISALDRHRILSVEACYSTDISCAIEKLLSTMKAEQLIHNNDAFENLTLVWLTDGQDNEIHESADLVKLFQAGGCLDMPRLIAVGIGDYNEALLNGVAEEVRFKSNLMLHIDSPDKTHELFQVVANNIGMMRRRIILVVDTEGKMTYQDLGIIQASQTKQLVMEMPIPRDGVQQMTYRLLINDQIYRLDLPQPLHFNRQDKVLLIAYFTQLHDKIVLAMRNNPVAAEAMRECVLRSIPSTVHDPRLIALRNKFMPPMPVTSLLEEDLQRRLASTAWQDPDTQVEAMFNYRLFSPATSVIEQDLYSQALQSQYSKF